MAEGVIRNFVVALGFTTDKSKADEMKKTLENVEVRAKILHKALLGLAVGSVVAVTKVADELDKLYFSSQRIGASANNINAYGNAIAQLGGSAEGAIGTLESLAEKLRNSPGYESQIKGLGVDTREANGEMRDRVEVMKDLSGVLAKMPAYQANAYAESLGIDQNTLLAMRDGKFLSNMEKYQKIQKELGMNDDLTKSGNEFMTEYRDLTMMTKTGFQVLVMQAGKALIPILRLLNQLIQVGIHAFSQLHPAIKGFLATGLQLATFGLVLNAVIKSFGMLKTGLSVIKMFIPALKAFRLAFLASPIGIILALVAALGLLYDDYKTWREGGKSLFDWTKWTEGIDFIIEKIQDFLDLLDKIKDKTVEFINKVINNPAEAFEDLVEGAKNTAEKVGDALANPQPDKNGNVSEPRDFIAKAMDTGFGWVDKGLSALGNEDAEQRVKQREKGEIGYQDQTTVVKDMTSIATTTAKAIDKAVKDTLGTTKTEFSKNTLHLSKQDIEDLIKVTSTEVVPSLKGDAFTKQTQGVVDTILNRVVSGKWGDSVRDVANARRQFTKITGPKSYKTKSGKVISLNPYGSVQNMPDKDVNPRVKAEVLKYLNERAEGKKSSIGEHLNYANPYVSDAKNRKAWVDAFYKKAEKDNLVFGSGKNVHGHGTTQDLVKFKPKPFHLSLSSPNALQNGGSSLKTLIADQAIKNNAPPTSNPEKSQTNNLNSKSNTSNVTIHQEFKTDMTINGATSPVDSANAVKRQQDNSLVIMARGVKGLMP